MACNLTPAPEEGKQCSFTLAAVHAFLTVGKSLVISEQKVDDFERSIQEEFKKDGIPADVFDNSITYGQKMAAYYS